MVDPLGLLPAAEVTAASVQDSIAGTALIDQIATDHPSLRTTWVDGGYRRHLVEHAATLGIDMQIVQRPPGTRGFTPLPPRWVAERTLGWLMLHRRPVRDYETLPASSQAMIHIAMIDLMSRRLTGEATPTWRGTRPGTKQKPRDETSTRDVSSSWISSTTRTWWEGARRTERQARRAVRPSRVMVPSSSRTLAA
ncbi:Transposase DDE domain-containing protein [Thermomonospora echinospora]|uniref:Transposase DDE domain-containing protein n=1 Tax=Thermomonospora echinospora TaxID=1992 RepID=A0A1H6E3R9_9ACTN|nr:Transposase DDE domain-containing protein [Thermomonospora echinospora]